LRDFQSGHRPIEVPHASVGQGDGNHERSSKPFQSGRDLPGPARTLEGFRGLSRTGGGGQCLSFKDCRTNAPNVRFLVVHDSSSSRNGRSTSVPVGEEIDPLPS
jgi:hypothetical protein